VLPCPEIPALVIKSIAYLNGLIIISRVCFLAKIIKSRKKMKLGIIGLKNSGKTTLFNALTRACAPTSSNPYMSAKPNIGAVAVPDERLEKLTEIFKPKKTTPAYIEFVDIAGFSKVSFGPDSKAANQFFSHIREVDALVHVIRCFVSGDAVLNDENKIDPSRDISALNIELIVSDLEIVENRIANILKQPRNTDLRLKQELEVLNIIKSVLENEKPARNASLKNDELKLIRSLNLLTLKPLIFCANIQEKHLSKNNQNPKGIHEAVEKISNNDNPEIISVCAKIEEEISLLEGDDKKIFMKELGIELSGLEKLVEASYKVLGLISFLTAGPDEVRAWTIKKGDKAPKAAGKIHSDIERGFIRAETVPYPVFMQTGSFIKAKEKGLMRAEGKEYVINDGDIIDFRFNV
jgi:GTP-binding protein YchF